MMNTLTETRARKHRLNKLELARMQRLQDVGLLVLLLAVSGMARQHMWSCKEAYRLQDIVRLPSCAALTTCTPSAGTGCSCLLDVDDLCF